MASSVDGTIDSAYKYAWSENIGWINFGTSGGNVHVVDSGLSGYVWSDNYGWINLAPPGGGVKNNNEGNLFGYAWGENLGWINFSGVIISPSGEFSGLASGDITGRVSFDCANCKVKTDWRPQSARSSGLPPGAYNPPAPPPSGPSNSQAGFKIFINPSINLGQIQGAKYTNNPAVKLALIAGADTARMSISESPVFVNGNQEPYQSFKNWTLSSGDGVKTIYARFYTSYGVSSETVSGAIILDTKPPEIKIIKIKDYYSSAEDIILIGATETKAEIILNWNKKYGLISADEQGNLMINLGKMPAGEYQLTLTAADLAGNKSDSLMVNLTIKPAEAPEIATEAVPEKPFYPGYIERIIERAPEILKPLIPKFLWPKEWTEEKPEEMIAIPEEAPLSFGGKWKLISYTRENFLLEKFVLAPLPKEIRKLAEKFPELGETLKKVGITKITDIEKLKTVKLTLPGLTERVGLPMAKIGSGKFALPQGVPIVKMSPEIKKAIPSEIVFVKTGGELIDFNITLTIGEKGEPKQKISVISGKPLQLAIKPDKPVKSVKGYVAFKARFKNRESRIMEQNSTAIIHDSEFIIQNLAASLVFANPVFAHPARNEPLVFVEGAKPQSEFSKILAILANIANGASPQEKPVRVEEKLVLLEFEYTDPDNDGIYTAEISAPIVEGEYEIITVMDFEDPELGKKEIRLIAIVDPEGYIYEKNEDKETRVPGAVASIYWLNPEIKQYELWPAKEYQQENPQITDITGKYSFLVPEGFYYLKVEAPGYLAYDGKPFQIKEGGGVHANIELKTQYWWLKAADWKTLALILVIILLLYNFYRDKMRERLMRKM